MRRRSNLSQNPTTRPTRWAAPDIIGTISQIHKDANQIELFGASQNWCGNSLAVGLCRRWLAWLTGTWRGAGQAPSLALAGCQSVRGHRAGTRPAPTVAAREVRTVVVGGWRQRVGVETRLARHVAGEERTRWGAEGGRCGGNPPAQGRAEGLTAQMRGERRERHSLFWGSV